MKFSATAGVFLSMVFFLGCSQPVEEDQDAPSHDQEHDHEHDHEHENPDTHSQNEETQPELPPWFEVDSDTEKRHSPHSGVVSTLYVFGEQTGYIELKLHDDKGDLELWVTQDQNGTEPFDLPLDTVIHVTFPELDDRSVELRVRNQVNNEDEDGKETIRNGKTNYFIFPGETRADASFLLGKEFVSDVVLTFETRGVEFTTKQFELHPHVH